MEGQDKDKDKDIFNKVAEKTINNNYILETVIIFSSFYYTNAYIKSISLSR